MTKLELQIEKLEESLAHWRRMRAYSVEDFYKPQEEPGFYGCSCCHEWNTLEYGCRGCPIFDDTGKACCRDTPYRHASMVFDRAQVQDASIDDWRDAADKEIDYLADLLDRLKQKWRMAMTDHTPEEMAEHLADALQRIRMIWGALPEEIRDQCGVHVHACIDISRIEVEGYYRWRATQTACDRVSRHTTEALNSTEPLCVWTYDEDDDSWASACGLSRERPGAYLFPPRGGYGGLHKHVRYCRRCGRRIVRAPLDTPENSNE